MILNKEKNKDNSRNTKQKIFILLFFLGLLVSFSTYSQATFVDSYSSCINTNVNSITLNIPSGDVDDLLIAAISSDERNTQTFNTPSGWVLIQSAITPNTNASLAVYYRVADGLEGATETFTVGLNDELCGAIIRYDNVDNLHNPIDVSALASSNNGSANPPTITSNYNYSSVINFVAVDKINFSINQGEILGLIGESGSGKSVASQSITRLIDDAQLDGEVLFLSEGKHLDLLKCSEMELLEIRKNEIAYIFQEPMTALNPLISCGKQILESASEKSYEFLNSLLLKVELTETKRVANSYPHELSGGQRQRVMIAMAMSCDPDILIADEPTGNLDQKTGESIYKLLSDLREQMHTSFVVVTHDTQLAERLDRSLNLLDGCLTDGHIRTAASLN